MRMTHLFLKTMRETPSEADTIGHRLMLRAGLIRKQAAGVYSFMPLGYRALRKIEGVIREEMDAIGAQELLFPSLLPAECFSESGKIDSFGEEVFRLKDRYQRDLCLGSGYEEIFAETVRDFARSYRDLPLVLYQVRAGYSDEAKPRFGIMRCREFMTMDACSFDRDENGPEASCEAMFNALKRIFGRIGLEYVVLGDGSGTMGDPNAREFMVISEAGETGIVHCPGCGYAASVERAQCAAGPGIDATDPLPPEYVATPEARTIAEVTAFLGCSETDLAKTILYKADGRLIAAMVRGDRGISEAKLMSYLGCNSLEMADEESVRTVTGAEVGFAGPVGLPVRIIADLEIAGSSGFITGANRTGFHLRHVVPGRDFKAEYADIRMIAETDPCPRCGAKPEFARALMVGHVCRLGSKISGPTGCIYLDETGTGHPMAMGSCKIFLNRAMAAIIEQHHDDNGIIWPMGTAPYQAVIVPVNVLDEKQAEIAENLYRELKERGAEVLLDDRNERAGVKFKDADLIGIPVRVNVGRKIGEGLVEFRLRHEEKARDLPLDKAADAVMEAIKEALA